jgi:hypothetical protein
MRGELVGSVEIVGSVQQSGVVVALQLAEHVSYAGLRRWLEGRRVAFPDALEQEALDMDSLDADLPHPPFAVRLQMNEGTPERGC